MTIYQMYDIRTDVVEIKFADLIDSATLVNANFVITKTDATPVVVSAAPFNDIIINRDYYSISRTLFLYWNITLEEDSYYTLTISGLKDVIGATLPTEVISFNTVGIEIDTTEILQEAPTRVPVDVEDYSIKDIAPFFPSIIFSSAISGFRVVDIKPTLENSAYLNSSYNEGRIEIEFSDIIAANFISNEYFKMERKLFTQGITRWEVVNTITTSDDNLVIIYMPSNDETPLYGEPDKTYWEEGYRYRLRISAEIGPPTLA